MHVWIVLLVQQAAVVLTNDASVSSHLVRRIDPVAEATAHLVAVVEETIDVDLLPLAIHHLSIRQAKIMIVAKVAVVGLVFLLLVSELLFLISFKLDIQRSFEFGLSSESLLLKVGILVFVVRFDQLDHFVLVQVALLALALLRNVRRSDL